MILRNLECGIGRHFIFKGVFIFAVIAKEYVFVHVENSVFNVLLSESGKEFTIQVIRDSSAIQHLAEHVLQHSSVDLGNLILVRSQVGEVVQILFDKGQRGFQIGVVELIGHAPTERAKLTPFDDYGV